MRRVLSIICLVAAAAALWAWHSGTFDQLAAWAAGEQRAFQNQIARTLRGIRTGDAGAVGLLLTLCFSYGFFHAIGPGHGKIVIGGYGLGRQVPWLRLSLISLASSLAQAVTAIAVVYAGIWIFQLGREALVGVTENYMAPLSYAAIGLIGLWLVWRGLRRLRASASHTHNHAHAHHHHHDHTHDHDENGTCNTCGHSHGPTIEQASNTNTLREALILIGGIALRPCTGALFVLIITWQMGIALAGIAGAFAMALGTATVTIAVGLAAVGVRGSMIESLSGSRLTTTVIPLIEIIAGGVIALIASGFVLRALS
jgi:ABC-type nickel/cobalt efflux system permease component RcnA